MKSTSCVGLSSVLVVSLVCGVSVAGADLSREERLWPLGIPDNPIQYASGEQVRSYEPALGSLSGGNRVFSSVSEPEYILHQATRDKANGVGLVICPGGGYRDVWLDREGHDLGLWLSERGVTCLVLKYRTNSGAGDRQHAYGWETYLPAVFADARQAIRVMRSRAAELGVDPEKVGICGFSAGGNLALNTVFSVQREDDKDGLSSEPDFAGLFYPWFREDVGEVVSRRADIPPLFIMNAVDDDVTPAGTCVAFFQAVRAAGGAAEMHLFSRGGHGFDLGAGRGESASRWPESFLAWLQDTGFIP